MRDVAYGLPLVKERTCLKPVEHGVAVWIDELEAPAGLGTRLLRAMKCTVIAGGVFEYGPVLANKLDGPGHAAIVAYLSAVASDEER